MAENFPTLMTNTKPQTRKLREYKAEETPTTKNLQLGTHYSSTEKRRDWSIHPVYTVVLFCFQIDIITSWSPFSSDPPNLNSLLSGKYGRIVTGQYTI